MKNTTLTDAELIAYSGEHLLYEFQYFWYAANELSKITTPTPMESVFIESFGLHLRNLIDFFYTTAGKERDSDVIAADFCPVWNEKIPVTLDAARVRANKELSHLTLQRKSSLDTTKRWDVVSLFNEIKSVANRYVTHADTTKLSPKIGEWLTSHHSIPSTTVAVVLGLMATSSTATMSIMPPVDVIKR